jgi:GNAT acetyltransferase-like protein
VTARDRARAMWEGLAGGRVSFGPPGSLAVAVAPDSPLCPPGWCGVVGLGGAAVAAAPDTRRAGLLLAAWAAGAPPDRLAAALAAREVLGPAELSYLDAARFRPVAGAVETLDPADPAVATLRRGVPTADDAESALHEVTSPVFAVRAAGGAVVAAAGYRRWPGPTAHLSVLTATDHRGRGLARLAASAAVAHALESDLLPQWRARPAASRRVAAALGFRVDGLQISLLVA